jgi:putative glutamine amidotransferase
VTTQPESQIVERSSFVLVTSTTEIIRGVSRVRVNEAYTEALRAAGLVPLVLPPVPDDLAVRALEGVAGLVLTGGEDMDPALYGQAPHPAAGAPHVMRDQYEIALCRAARDRSVPTLAICRGAQVMNVALGGTLVQDIPDQVRGAIPHAPLNMRDKRVHRVRIDERSLLAAAIGTTDITVNSSHHQSVDRVPDGLRVNARADDGVIEGLESTDPAWWMVGVQWHPEELTATDDAWDRDLFTAFAKRCAMIERQPASVIS